MSFAQRFFYYGHAMYVVAFIVHLFGPLPRYDAVGATIMELALLCYIAARVS